MSTQQPPNPNPPSTHHLPRPPIQPSAPIKPSPMRNLSEFAVADTPGTAGPEYAATGGGGDYLQCRFVPISSPVPGLSPAPTPGLAPAVVSRGVQGVQGSGGGGEGGVLAVGRGGGVEVDGDADVDVDADAGVDMRREMGVRRDPEGKGAVGGSVEGGASCARARRGSMSVGGDGGGLGEVRPGVSRSSPGGFHGRGRGEVSLGAGEADLERKKQQQAAARKQLMDARKRGEDVDGRGTAGPSGRQPRAEID